MSKIEWKDVTTWSRSDIDRSIPKTWELRFGCFRLSVSRHIHYPPTSWVASCQGMFQDIEMGAKDINEAKYEALRLVAIKLRGAVEDLRQVGVTI